MLGKDYIYMNSSVCRNGTSFVESLFEKFGECYLQYNAVKYVSIKTFDDVASLYGLMTLILKISLDCFASDTPVY